MKLFIKNLYGDDQKRWLSEQLDDLGIVYEKDIRLGEIILGSIIPQAKLSGLKSRLTDKSLEMIYDRKHILAEQVKYLVHEMLERNEPPEENYSQYISSRLFLNYTYLANIFSETQGITIEHFIINQRIEKVKQLLLYSDHSISQIADIMHYSSIGHLSNQFKKVTGMNPSEFKKNVQKASFE
jgi:AraC-like DNA-binding protein